MTVEMKREDAERVLEGQCSLNESGMKTKLTQRLLSLSSVCVYFVAIVRCQLSCLEEELDAIVRTINVVTILKKVKWKD